jgi:hypothetical protein
LEVTDEKSSIRVRICNLSGQLQGSGSVPNCHGSGRLACSLLNRLHIGFYNLSIFYALATVGTVPIYIFLSTSRYLSQSLRSSGCERYWRQFLTAVHCFSRPHNCHKILAADTYPLTPATQRQWFYKCCGFVSGSVNFWASQIQILPSSSKKVSKALITTGTVLRLFGLFIFGDWCKCTFKK